MILWWKTRQKRLWWKELRESWPVLGLGWMIIIIFAYKVPADVSSRYIWGMDFNMTATAILLFVVMVLGVTAYAVEEEYKTLEPLMSKPISPHDILATKLGVRLGLVFFSALLIGAIELLTGAWPIEYGIPSPVIFERWMGSLMIMICGLGLGFYFGKVLGHQITALLSACLIFGAGWVLLELSPLSFLFEGEEGETIYWIKQILLPGLLGTVAILASIRARIGEGNLLTRPAVAAAALAGYALLSWSLTVVPPGRAWASAEVYSAHWAVQFGSPEAGLDALVNMYLRNYHWEAEADPDSVATTIVMQTSIYPPSRTYRYERTGYSSLLGVEGRRVSTYDRRPSVSSRIHLTVIAAEKRSADWIGKCLEIAREPGRSVNHKLVALHLAGRANHSENTEAIASYLESPSQYVRLMAAYMLLAREDPRAEGVLTRLIGEVDKEILLSNIVYQINAFRIDLGPDLRLIMQEWLQRTGNENRDFRNVARFWFNEHGSREDLDLIRRSLWLNVSERNRQTRTINDLQIWRYLKSWNDPGLSAEFHMQARKMLDELAEIQKEAHYILERERRYRSLEEILKVNRYSMLTSNLRAILGEMAAQYDPAVIDLYDEYILLTYRDDMYPSTLPYISFLPGMGEEGIQKLREMVDDNRISVFRRFQASLILTHHGYDGYDSIALRYFELFKDSRYQGYYWGSTSYEAFLVLIEEDHLQFIGPVIERAWKVFQSEGRYQYFNNRGYIYTRAGTYMWNNWTADVLKAATGLNFGWDLKKWKKWWDREGKELAMAGN